MTQTLERPEQPGSAALPDLRLQHLMGVGLVGWMPAADLVPGDVRLYTFGYQDVIARIETVGRRLKLITTKGTEALVRQDRWIPTVRAGEQWNALSREEKNVLSAMPMSVRAERKEGVMTAQIQGSVQTPAPTMTHAHSSEAQAYLDRLLSPAKRAYARALLLGEAAHATTLDQGAASKVRAQVERFTRKDTAQADLFSFNYEGQKELPAAPPRVPTVRTPVLPSPARIAERFHKLADGMQRSVDSLARVPFDGQNATRRRASFQASRAEDHRRARELQRVLYALGNAAQNGTLDPILAGIGTRRVAESLLRQARWQNEHDGKNLVAKLPVPHLYNASNLTPFVDRLGAKGEPARRVLAAWHPETTELTVEDARTLHAALNAVQAGPEGKAFRKVCHSGLMDQFTLLAAFLAAGLSSNERVHAAMQAMRPYQAGKLLSDEELRAAKVKQMEHALIGANYAGYFPTPALLAETLVDEAMISPGMEVLEPSAGKGDLCDLIRDAGGIVSAIEPVHALREVLGAKGHAMVGHDLLNFKGEFDRIVMNPPFEKRQDALHVQYAYKLLKPGGRLVAIVSEGLFNGRDQEAQAFRDFLEAQDAFVTENPEGAFKISAAGRSTGVRTRTVAIDRPG